MIHDEADFSRYRSKVVQVGDVRSFGDFIVELPDEVDIDDFNTVVVWCESFEELIASARYR